MIYIVLHLITSRPIYDFMINVDEILELYVIIFVISMSAMVESYFQRKHPSLCTDGLIPLSVVDHSGLREQWSRKSLGVCKLNYCPHQASLNFFCVLNGLG